MNFEQLNEAFAIPGHLEFGEHAGLTCARATLASARATVFLHGAHVTDWQPAGKAPVLWLSEKSEFSPGKPIRGGIPICFPWFGPRSDGRPGPSHGFARTEEWEFAFAALVPGEAGDALNLTFTLGPSELSRSLGFDRFRAVYEVIVGSTLQLRLTVANTGEDDFYFEEALHTYFAVGDVRRSTLTGLESALFLDKTDAMREKRTPDAPLQLTGETDRVFPANRAPVAIHDPQQERVIRIEKSGSNTTVVWNPWTELAAKLADVADDAWPGFVCVETANTAADAITLKPGESHSMQALLTVQAA